MWRCSELHEVLVQLQVWVLPFCTCRVEYLIEVFHEGLHKPRGLGVLGALVGDVDDSHAPQVLLEQVAVLAVKEGTW